MENVLIFGARGYLGRAFQSTYPDALCPDVNIADARAVAEILDCEKPDIVINAAGKTGRPNIDWCEDHKAETLRSNLIGPLVLLEECGKRNIYWVHLSSGCIYEGVGSADSLPHGGRVRERGSTSGFTESDPPNFFGSFYSRVKGWCDQILREFAEPQDGKG
ncbi:NAD-dependent epimerase/dehydratase family protein, partial [Candidatus Peregrinibacteria bacterium]|nr:NAD-dependent epimerase/dehydratase family protein [Candidatus Peregrinibacteria bacterium]